MDHEDDKCVLREKLQVERITPQRVLIFDIIKNESGHLHVEDIYEKARKKDQKINLSTVYRTLKEFKKAGIVAELHLEQDHHHYERADKDEHHHLVCEECGDVVDFTSGLVEKLQKSVEKKHGFAVSDSSVQMSGLCRGCQ